MPRLRPWRLLAALPLAGLVALAGAVEPVEPDPARLVADLPAPEGWKADGAPTIYDADTLYEYIDGAARLYTNHGFTRLAHLRWVHPGEENVGIDLDVYHMGGTLGAYGIYSNTRPPDATTESWGVEGYLHGGVAAAWKGPIYVRAKAESRIANADTILAGMVRNVAQRVPGEAAPPRLLSLLPEQNRVPNSDRYVPRDLLGHAFLPGGILADYVVEGEEYRLFLLDMGSEPPALAAWSNLKEYQKRNGGEPRKQKGIGDDAFRVADPGLGLGLVMRKGSVVAGVWGGSPESEAPLRLLQQVVTRVEGAGRKPAGGIPQVPVNK